MKKHTQETIAFICYIGVLGLASYYVTPWVWLAILLGWSETECGCDECQNIPEQEFLHETRDGDVDG